MDEKELKVGQVLYRKMTGKSKPDAYTISKIGRKYFYLNGDERHPINKHNLRHEDPDYSQFNFQLYRTEQEIFDNIEKNQLFETIRKGFDWSIMIDSYTLEQLRQAAYILGLTTLKTEI